MSEEEILKYLYYFTSSKIKNKKLSLQDLCGFDLGYLNVETIQKSVEGLVNLYEQEKEKNKNLEKDKKYKDRIIKGLGLNTIPRTITSFNKMIDKYYINKDKIRDLIVERQFELQQEFKDFKDDIRLNTLQEIYYLE